MVCVDVMRKDAVRQARRRGVPAVGAAVSRGLFRLILGLLQLEDARVSLIGDLGQYQ